MSKEVIYSNLGAPDLRSAMALENRTQLLCGTTGEMTRAIEGFRRKSNDTRRID
ncbi:MULTISPECIES: hypothetical protein [unclassified Pseudomonas]|uniref:hypothetical protein n=1 Tax=unclassified Pseudomonas TaxID=196821 RepID=UPI0025E502C6|nr:MULTISPECIES: hypothetical protein [unclassified Pseudomonas]